MVAGLISALKTWFRRRQAQHAVDADDGVTDTTGANGTTELYKIDILTAMRRCQDAWESVSPTAIANCWSHAGILLEDVDDLASASASVRIE